jgi:TrmH family RNA methyltransferase
MISKAQSKRILALHTNKVREKEGLFLAEGRKVMQELAQADGWNVLLYLLPLGVDEPWIHAIKTAAPDRYWEVEPEEIARHSTLQNNTEGLAVVEDPQSQNFSPKKNTLYLALDGIRDPGNLGTLIRLADWFNISDILCTPDTVEWQNPKVIAASMGSFLRTRIHYGALDALLAKIPTRYGALLQGEPSYTLKAPTTACALVIGSESHGIHKETLPLITHPVTIPRLGHAESLNAAMAAGILLYELRRG